MKPLEGRRPPPHAPAVVVLTRQGFQLLSRATARHRSTPVATESGRAAAAANTWRVNHSILRGERTLAGDARLRGGRAQQESVSRSGSGPPRARRTPACDRRRRVPIPLSRGRIARTPCASVRGARADAVESGAGSGHRARAQTEKTRATPDARTVLQLRRSATAASHDFVRSRPPETARDCNI